MTPFEAYKHYNAIKRHFSNESYDYFKYNGKLNLSETSFETRKDKYMFYKLSKKQDPITYLVANLSENPNLWVGDLFDKKHEQIYNDFIKRQQSMSYIFKNDIDLLLEDFDKNFEVVDGQHPHLLNLLRKSRISRESFIIINDCVRFFSVWNKKIEDPVIWPKIALQCKKYYPFIKYEKDKYCAMLKEKFS